LKFQKQPEDQTTMEGQTVKFTAVTNKPNYQAVWKKNNKPIDTSDTHYQIKDDGTYHFLVIPEALLDDDDNYTCSIEEIECIVRLKVQGNFH
jgi:hypothetical protein